MPVDPHASVRISAFKWVPPFAKGHVRDLRARSTDKTPRGEPPPTSCRGLLRKP